MTLLAISGGTPYIDANRMKRYNSIGEEEVAAAAEVVRSGNLSQFVGGWGEDFLGGPKVKQFEADVRTYFGSKHAISVNSWTSGLIAAVGAIEIEPGDEIITTPWTMCATATAILHWNAIPVFADIDETTFGLDVGSVEKHITSRTRAVLSVDIFGKSVTSPELRDLCKSRGLRLLTDTAQAPGAFDQGSYAGTNSDIGGLSLNYHKHVHTGEGGVLLTNDDDLALRMQLIRNHGEACVGPAGVTNLANMLGYNFRMGEIEAAIGIEQLKKLKDRVRSRQKAAVALSNGLSSLTGLVVPELGDNLDDNVFYVLPLRVLPEETKVSRDKIVAALRAEGLDCLGSGYTNVHLLPMYQRKIAYGSSGHPWTLPGTNPIDYSKGICPVAERLQDSEFITFEMCRYQLDENEVEGVLGAFAKVWENLGSLE